MNLYWVYLLPTWLFAILTIVVTTVVGLVGLCATRKWVRRIHDTEHSHNELVSFYLGAVCMFYGITLGLLAAAAWQNFIDVQTRVGEEAAAVGVLYRNVSAFPDPPRTQLKADLRAYAREVIDVAWPLQRQGIVPDSEGAILNGFQAHMTGFEPKPKAKKCYTWKLTPALIGWQSFEAEDCKVCAPVYPGRYGLLCLPAPFSASL